MRPTFMGFETAKRGIMINQKALDIVGNNIGNMGVTGYTRQRVDQVSISSHGMNSRFDGKSYNLAGQGATINGVSQVRDPYLDKRFRQENSDVGYYGKVSEIMSDVETALDEYSSTGLKSSLGKFSNAIAALSKDINTTNANVLRTAAMSLTQMLHQYDVKLNNIIDQQQYDLEVNVNSINLISARIAQLNESIAKDSFENDYASSGNYFGPNELLDERNVLLDELSKYGEIETTTNRDMTVDVKMAGHDIIKGNKSDTVMFEVRSDNTVNVTWQTSGKAINTTTGVLAASVNMINGRGPTANSNENYERGIPYYKAQVDSFARSFADTFNNIIPSYDASGVIEPGVYKTLFVFDATQDPGAASIGISNHWDNSSDYILTPKNLGGEYDNTYYNKMAEQLKAAIRFDNGYKGTFEEYVTSYNTTLGEDKTFHEGRLSASGAIAESVMDSISQVSGVSMDEEGADMMAYNKAYAAMSRVLTALDEALDTLINRTGLVGR